MFNINNSLAFTLTIFFGSIISLGLLASIICIIVKTLLGQKTNGKEE